MDATFGDQGQQYGAEPEWVRYSDRGYGSLGDEFDEARVAQTDTQWHGARGLVFGLLFSVPFWLVIALAVVASNN